MPEDTVFRKGHIEIRLYHSLKQVLGGVAMDREIVISPCVSCPCATAGQHGEGRDAVQRERLKVVHAEKDQYVGAGLVEHLAQSTHRCDACIELNWVFPRWISKQLRRVASRQCSNDFPHDFLSRRVCFVTLISVAVDSDLSFERLESCLREDARMISITLQLEAMKRSVTVVIASARKICNSSAPLVGPLVGIEASPVPVKVTICEQCCGNVLKSAGAGVPHPESKMLFVLQCALILSYFLLH